MTIPSFLVLNRDGAVRRFWRNFRVIAGPRHCIIKKRL